MKIGITSQLPKRLAALRSSSGAILEVLRLFRGDEHDERALHAVLDEFRLYGEWFHHSERAMLLVDGWIGGRPLVDPESQAPHRPSWKCAARPCQRRATQAGNLCVSHYLVTLDERKRA